MDGVSPDGHFVKRASGARIPETHGTVAERLNREAGLAGRAATIRGRSGMPIAPRLISASRDYLTFENLAHHRAADWAQLPDQLLEQELDAVAAGLAALHNADVSGLQPAPTVTFSVPIVSVRQIGSMSSAAVAVLREIHRHNDAFTKLAAASNFRSQQAAFIHNDLGGRNILIDWSGAMPVASFVDWELAGRGHSERDLGTVLADVLVERYLAALAIPGPKGPTFATLARRFCDEYRRCGGIVHSRELLVLHLCAEILQRAIAIADRRVRLLPGCVALVAVCAALIADVNATGAALLSRPRATPSATPAVDHQGGTTLWRIASEFAVSGDDVFVEAGAVHRCGSTLLRTSLSKSIYTRMHACAVAESPAAATGVANGIAELYAEFAASTFPSTGWSRYSNIADTYAKDGLIVRADAAAARYDSAEESYTLRLPCLRPASMPGYLVMISGYGPPAERGEIARIYVNADSADAPKAFGAIFRALVAARLKFEMKIADNDAMYRRTDPMVIYLDRSKLSDGVRLAQAATQMSDIRLRDHIPGFSRKVAPGVAVAPPAPDGSLLLSFGEQCSLLAAEALINDYTDAGRGSTVASRHRSLQKIFAEHNLGFLDEAESADDGMEAADE
jgi:hypothetical protein